MQEFQWQQDFMRVLQKEKPGSRSKNNLKEISNKLLDYPVFVKMCDCLEKTKEKDLPPDQRMDPILYLTDVICQNIEVIEIIPNTKVLETGKIMK